MEDREMKRNILLLLMALALMVGPAGCIFSPDDDDGNVGGNDNALPYPSDTEILIANFKRIYTEMRIDDFKAMLHSEYKTVLLPSTLEEWNDAGNPLAEDVFYREDEINIHQNMFSGNTGLRPNGDTVPPIASIQVDLLSKLTSWELIPESHVHFAGQGGYWALFHVNLSFYLPDGSRFQVQQDVEFYVVPTDDNGRTKWLLLGQVGLEPNNTP
jgi:hypothetical protein